MRKPESKQMRSQRYRGSLMQIWWETVISTWCPSSGSCHTASVGVLISIERWLIVVRILLAKTQTPCAMSVLYRNCLRQLNFLFLYYTFITVPIHSIQRSQVTGPAEPLKGHRCPRSQTRVPKSKRNTKNAKKKCQFFLWPVVLWKIHNSKHLWHSELFLILDHIFYPNTETFWLYVRWNLDMVTRLSPIRRIQNFSEAVTGHKACKIEWIGTVNEFTHVGCHALSLKLAIEAGRTWSTRREEEDAPEKGNCNWWCEQTRVHDPSNATHWHDNISLHGNIHRIDRLSSVYLVSQETSNTLSRFPGRKGPLWATGRECSLHDVHGTSFTSINRERSPT